jgi:hypothetical protein
VERCARLPRLYFVSEQDVSQSPLAGWNQFSRQIETSWRRFFSSKWSSVVSLLSIKHFSVSWVRYQYGGPRFSRVNLDEGDFTESKGEAAPSPVAQAKLSRSHRKFSLHWDRRRPRLPPLHFEPQASALSPKQLSSSHPPSHACTSSPSERRTIQSVRPALPIQLELGIADNNPETAMQSQHFLPTDLTPPAHSLSPTGATSRR